MKKSLMTYYIFLLIAVLIVIYSFSHIDTKVYHPPKEAHAQTNYDNTIYEDIIMESNTKEFNNLEENITTETELIEEKCVSLGEFKLTAYCPCGICCGKWAYNRQNGIVYGAIGEELKEGYSIAVDPNVIPYRTEVIINGNTYKAQDCGGAIKGNRIDVYFEDHNDALEFGVQYAEVFIKI